MASSQIDTLTPPPVVSALGTAVEVEERAGLRLAATLASSMLPGAGQWFLGASVNATLFNVGFLALVGLYWVVRIPETYPKMVGALVGAWALFTLSTWDALRNCRSKAQPRPAIWLGVFIPIALLVSTAFTNAVMQETGFLTYGIPSQSMEHTLNIGDRLIVDVRYYKDHVVQPGDVIIFRKDDKQFCKRVIATGGSQVEGINGVIYIGGEPTKEAYVQHVGGAPDDMNNFGPIVVPTGMMFVMGDNRDDSFDSRSPEFGMIPEASVVGRPLYIYYSETATRNGRQLQ